MQMLLCALTFIPLKHRHGLAIKVNGILSMHLDLKTLLWQIKGFCKEKEILTNFRQKLRQESQLGVLPPTETPTASL